MMDNQPKGQNLPFLKPEDAQYFDKLLVEVDEESLTPDELKERQIMELLLKIKNGTPPMRKSALRRITDKARHFGAGPLFNQILPLLMSPTLEDQERHLLVKVCVFFDRESKSSGPKNYFVVPVCEIFVCISYSSTFLHVKQ